MNTTSKLYVSYRPSFSHPVAIWAYSLVQLFVGQIITVYFTKRTTSETRRMVCVWGESAPITRRKWDPSKKQLLNVFDVEKGEYRFISMDAVQRIVIGGTTYLPHQMPQPEPTPQNDYYAHVAESREQSFSDLKDEMHALFI